MNSQCPHTLAQHINPTAAINDGALNVMYKRLGFSTSVETELVCTEGINSLRLIGGWNVDRVKTLVKAIRRPGGVSIYNAMSETAEHHLIVAFHICKYWHFTSWQTKLAPTL